MCDWLCLFIVRDSRYMRLRIPYMGRGPGQLTVPGGATVFLFGEEDRDGMATVIYDGQVRKDRGKKSSERQMEWFLAAPLWPKVNKTNQICRYNTEILHFLSLYFFTERTSANVTTGSCRCESIQKQKGQSNMFVLTQLMMWWWHTFLTIGKNKTKTWIALSLTFLSCFLPQSVPSGIPLPPGFKPPTRPHSRSSAAASPGGNN